MSVAIVRISGAVLGGAVAHSIVLNTVLHCSRGESSIGAAIWFWCGGWMVVSCYYMTGVVIGYFVLLPLLNAIGTAILRLTETIQDRR